jgi:tRNA (guanine37-N1)-methyltransferase
MRFDVVTVFPEMISEALKWGVVGRALEKKIFQVNTVNPRDFTSDIHKTIDDRPFGGGDGMVMLFEPISKACASISGFSEAKKIFLSPAGKRMTDQIAMELSQVKHVVLLSGRYGGVDQRLVNHLQFEMISMGDYVLSGGEIPALALIDAVVRKLPGVLGHSESAHKDSLAGGAGLEAPMFTRPRENAGGKVPEMLLSGDHKKMEDYRNTVGFLLTLQNRPDLLDKPISERETKQLSEFIKKQSREELLLMGLQTSFLERF